MSGKDNIYCIILTKFKLIQGVALYRSLLRYACNPKVFILCMDDETYELLVRLGFDVSKLMKLECVEDDCLKEIKVSRKLNEYCWTIKPYLIEYLLRRNSDSERVTYLDADLYFFSNPEKIFNDAPYCSVLLTKHDFSPEIAYMAGACGIYNSGFISTRSCSNGLECILWWKEKCLKWCRDITENGRFGDQKYLDNMPFFFKKACTVKTQGVNIAPWNQSKYQFKKVGGKIYVNDSPLIFYHFSGLRVLDEKEAALTLDYGRDIIPHVYSPYKSELRRIINEIMQLDPKFSGFYIEEKLAKDAYIIELNDD